MFNIRSLTAAVIIIILIAFYFLVFNVNDEIIQNSLFDDTAVVIKTGVITGYNNFCGFKSSADEYWSTAELYTQISGSYYIKTSVKENSYASLKLKNGTKIVLNSSTRLRINSSRSIDIGYGEIYLDVVKTGEPFYINTGKGRVKVTGTKLNIKKNNRELIVTLISGKADFITKTKKIIIERCLSIKDGLIYFSNPDVEETLRWFNRLKQIKPRHKDKGIGELVCQVDGTGVNLSIIRHKVNVEIQGFTARTEVEEIFFNHTKRRLEGTFYFPLPADASISGFSMWIGDKKVDGEIVERFRARQIYEKIVRKKRDPALLEWMGGNMFKMRIFPIEGRSPKKIRLVYTQVLTGEDDRYEYVYPLLSEQLTANPLKIFSINVAIDKTAVLTRPEVTSHSGRVTDKGKYYVYKYKAQDYKPVNDFVMNYRLKSKKNFLIFSHYRDVKKGSDNNTKGGYFLLNFLPKISGTVRKEKVENYIFLFDSSGSMRNQNFKTGTKVIETYLELLPDNCRFNIINGDALLNKLSGSMIYNSSGSRIDALKYIHKIEPYGGTNLLKLFEEAEKFIEDKTEIIYIGDGIATLGLTEDNTLLKRISKKLDKEKVKIFTITPGTGYNKKFLEKLTNYYDGLSVYVSNSGQITEIIEKVIHNKNKPVVRKISYKIEPEGVKDIVPGIIADKIAGTPVNITGRFEKEGDYILKTEYYSNDKKYEKGYQFHLTKDDVKNSFIPRVWAVHNINKLLDDIQTADTESSIKIRDEIIRLSGIYSVMTPYTSFLVLESEKDYENYGVRRRYKMKEWSAFKDNEKGKIFGGARLINFEKNYDLKESEVKRKEKLKYTKKSFNRRKMKSWYFNNGNVNAGFEMPVRQRLDFNGPFSPMLDEISNKKIFYNGQVPAMDIISINGSAIKNIPVYRPGIYRRSNYLNWLNYVFPVYYNYNNQYNEKEVPADIKKRLAGLLNPFSGDIEVNTKFKEQQEKYKLTVLDGKNFIVTGENNIAPVIITGKEKFIYYYPEKEYAVVYENVSQILTNVFEKFLIFNLLSPEFITKLYLVEIKETDGKSIIYLNDRNNPYKTINITIGQNGKIEKIEYYYSGKLFSTLNVEYPADGNTVIFNTYDAKNVFNKTTTVVLHKREPDKDLFKLKKLTIKRYPVIANPFSNTGGMNITSLDSLFAKTVTYFQYGTPGEAEEAISELVQRYPKNKELHFLDFMVMFYSGKMDKIGNKIDIIKKLDSDGLFICSNTLNFCIQNGLYDYIKDLVNYIYKNSDDTSSIINSFSQILNNYPDYGTFDNIEGEIGFMIKKYGADRRLLNAVSGYYYNRGDILKAIELKKLSGHLDENIVRYYLELDKYDEIKKYMINIVKSDTAYNSYQLTNCFNRIKETYGIDTVKTFTEELLKLDIKKDKLQNIYLAVVRFLSNNFMHNEIDRIITNIIADSHTDFNFKQNVYNTIYYDLRNIYFNRLFNDELKSKDYSDTGLRLKLQLFQIMNNDYNTFYPKKILELEKILKLIEDKNLKRDFTNILLNLYFKTGQTDKGLKLFKLELEKSKNESDISNMCYRLFNYLRNRRKYFEEELNIYSQLFKKFGYTQFTNHIFENCRRDIYEKNKDKPEIKKLIIETYKKTSSNLPLYLLNIEIKINGTEMDTGDIFNGIIKNLDNYVYDTNPYLAAYIESLLNLTANLTGMNKSVSKNFISYLDKNRYRFKKETYLDLIKLTDFTRWLNIIKSENRMNDEYRKDIAKHYLDDGNIDSSIEIYKNLARKYHKIPSFNYALWYMYRLKLDMDTAFKYWIKYVDNNTYLQNDYGIIEMAQQMAENGYLKEAEYLWNKLAENHHDPHYILETAVKILNKQDDRDGIYELFQSAVNNKFAFNICSDNWLKENILPVLRIEKYNTRFQDYIRNIKNSKGNNLVKLKLIYLSFEIENIRDMDINSETIIDDLIKENYFKYKNNLFKIIDSLVSNKKYELLEKIIKKLQKSEIRIEGLKKLFRFVRQLKRNKSYDAASALIGFIKSKVNTVKTQRECEFWSKLIGLVKGRKEEFFNYLENIEFKMDIDDIDEMFKDICEAVDKTNDTKYFIIVYNKITARHFNNYLYKIRDYFKTHRRYNDGIKFFFQLYKESGFLDRNGIRYLYDQFFNLVEESTVHNQKVDREILKSMIHNLIVESCNHRNFYISYFEYAVRHYNYQDFVLRIIRNLKLTDYEKINLGKFLKRFDHSNRISSKTAELIEQAIENGVTDRNIYSDLAVIYKKLNKPNKAVYYWKKHMEVQNYRNFYLYKSYAEYLYRAGDRKNAVKNIEIGLSYVQNNNYIWQRYRDAANLHFKNKNYAESVKYYNKTIEYADYDQFRDWTARQVFERLSECYAEEKDIVKAVETLHNGLPYISNNGYRQNLIEKMTDILIKNNYVDKYEKYYESEAEKENLEKPYLRLALGLAYDKINKKFKSMDNMELANKYMPLDKDIMNNLLKLYIKYNYYDKEIDLLKQFIELEPMNINYYQKIARVISRHTNKSDYRVWSMIVEILPTEAVSHSAFGKFLMRKNMYDEALIHLKKVIKYRPEEPDGYWNLAGLYKKMSRIAESRQLLEKMIKKHWNHRFGDVKERAEYKLKKLYR